MKSLLRLCWVFFLGGGEVAGRSGRELLLSLPCNNYWFRNRENFPVQFSGSMQKICFTSEVFSNYVEVKMSEIEIGMYKIIKTFLLLSIY